MTEVAQAAAVACAETTEPEVNLCGVIENPGFCSMMLKVLSGRVSNSNTGLSDLFSLVNPKDEN